MQANPGILQPMLQVGVHSFAKAREHAAVDMLPVARLVQRGPTNTGTAHILHNKGLRVPLLRMHCVPFAAEHMSCMTAGARQAEPAAAAVHQSESAGVLGHVE